MLKNVPQDTSAPFAESGEVILIEQIANYDKSVSMKDRLGAIEFVGRADIQPRNAVAFSQVLAKLIDGRVVVHPSFRGPRIRNTEISLLGEKVAFVRQPSRLVEWSRTNQFPSLRIPE